MYDLRDLVPVGRSAIVTREVMESDTAMNYSKALQELLATPTLIGLAIKASVEAIDKFLPDGFVSIGRSIEFEHTATSLLGVKVSVEVKVIDVEPTFIVLEITATDAIGVIGLGIHRRSIVNSESLLKKARERNERMMNSACAEF